MLSNLRLGDRLRYREVVHALSRMAEERQSRQPDVVPLGGHCGKFECTLWCQDENGSIEGGSKATALGHRGVIFHVKDRLNGD